jgi:hypothetical protein
VNGRLARQYPNGRALLLVDTTTIDQSRGPPPLPTGCPRCPTFCISLPLRRLRRAGPAQKILPLARWSYRARSMRPVNIYLGPLGTVIDVHSKCVLGAVHRRRLRVFDLDPVRRTARLDRTDRGASTPYPLNPCCRPLEKGPSLSLPARRARRKCRRGAARDRSCASLMAAGANPRRLAPRISKT